MRDDERELEFEFERCILEQIEYVIVCGIAPIWASRYYFVIVKKFIENHHVASTTAAAREQLNRRCPGG